MVCGAWCLLLACAVAAIAPTGATARRELLDEKTRFSGEQGAGFSGRRRRFALLE